MLGVWTAFALATASLLGAAENPTGQEQTSGAGRQFQPGIETRQRAQAEAQKVQQKLSEHRQEVIGFTQKEIAIVEGLDDIDLSIERARKEAATIHSETEALDNRITESAEASQELVAKINRVEAYAAERLAALYKLNQLGRFNVLASADSMYDLFQRKFALEKILTYDEDMRRELISNKARLRGLQEQLQREKDTKLALEEKIQKQIEVMSQKRAERSRLLEDIRDKKSLELAAIEVLKQSARSLDRRLQTLDTAAGSVEKQPRPASKAAAENFSGLKGLLKIPVRGTIETNFGSYLNPRLNVLNFRSGIDIKADRGEPVRAVSAGNIIFASWFKGYGNMIIVDHGDSYYTVYAHVEEFFKTKGDAVETDEVIATVGDTGSMMGPELYFEVRHHGKPLDPMEWIKRG